MAIWIFTHHNWLILCNQIHNGLIKSMQTKWIKSLKFQKGNWDHWYETKRDHWGGMCKPQIPILTLYTQPWIETEVLWHGRTAKTQNRDFWFTYTTLAIPSCFVAFCSNPYLPFKTFIFFMLTIPDFSSPF